MLSLLPAMLLLPMAELIPALPLRKEIGQALNGAPNQERGLLAWIELYESGNWEACDRAAEANGLNEEELLRFYGQALMWTDDALKVCRMR
jgi:c-di-GMP-related signal transduction protein